MHKFYNKFKRLGMKVHSVPMINKLNMKNIIFIMDQRGMTVQTVLVLLIKQPHLLMILSRSKISKIMN